MVEVIELMKSQGWVTRPEFCKLIKRAPGGNIPALAQDHGVRAVMVHRNGNGEVWMFRPEDASKIPSIEPDAAIPGGKNNGGKMFGMMAEMRKRIEVLEAIVSGIVYGAPNKTELGATSKTMDGALDEWKSASANATGEWQRSRTLDGVDGGKR